MIPQRRHDAQPVDADDLEHALATDQRFGIWGRDNGGGPYIGGGDRPISTDTVTYTDPAPKPTGLDWAKTIREPTMAQPPYAISEELMEFTYLLQRTEGHRDGFVRALRKLTVQAGIALKHAELAADEHNPPLASAPVESSTSLSNDSTGSEPPGFQTYLRAKAAVIRDWARENGVDCPPKGPVPDRVRLAYVEANR